MRLIYVHLGPDDLPAWYRHSVTSARQSDMYDLLLLSNRTHDIDIEQEVVPLPRLSIRASGLFLWSYARIHVLRDYLRRHDGPAWHMEGDNIVCIDLEAIAPSTKGVHVCRVGETHDSLGIMYISDYGSMRDFTAEADARAERMRHPSEMTVVSTMSRKKYLPTLPGQAQYVFDPASYGQYLGGTPSDPNPGFLDTVHHEIHRMIQKRQIHVTPWYVKQGEIKYPLVNMHIHSKRLAAFL